MSFGNARGRSSISTSSKPNPPSIVYFTSNIPRPLLAIIDPLIHHRPISNFKPDLERLRVHRQPIRQLVATEAVEDRFVLRVLRWQDFERNDASQERGVEFAVGKVSADAPIEESADWTLPHSAESTYIRLPAPRA